MKFLLFVLLLSGLSACNPAESKLIEGASASTPCNLQPMRYCPISGSFDGPCPCIEKARYRHWRYRNY